MKRAGREPYWALVRELNQHRPEKWVANNEIICLCSLCRFAAHGGTEITGCNHPLDEQVCLYDPVFVFDCWAFRPDGTIDGLRQEYGDYFEGIQAVAIDEGEGGEP